MAKELTAEEKQLKYDTAMGKIAVKRDKRLEYLSKKRARRAAKIDAKYADNPDKHEQEMGILFIDNDVWIDIANAQFEERAKTLELKYLKQ